MHAGLLTTVVEAPSQLYAMAATGRQTWPQNHADVCSTYANTVTIPGAGAGVVAAPAAGVIGRDNS